MNLSKINLWISTQIRTLNIQVLILLLCGISVPLWAVNIQQTTRSNSLTFEKLEDSRTHNGHVKNDYDFTFNLGLSYVDSPLVVKTPNKSTQIQPIINSMSTLHLGLGYFIKPWLMIGATGALVKFKDYNGNSYSGYSDSQIRAKLRLINTERFATSIVPFVDIPSNSGKLSITGLPNLQSLNGLTFNSLSDGKIGYGGLVSAEYLLNWAQLVINLGYRQNSGAFITDVNGNTQLDYRKQLITGIGAYVPISKRWGVNLEWLRKWTMPLSAPTAQAQNELFLGAGVGINNNIHLYSGVGIGNLFKENDGNDFRLSAGIKFATNIFAKKRQALKPVYEKNLPKWEKPKSCKINRFFGDSDTAVIRFEKSEYGIETKGTLVNEVLKYIVEQSAHISAVRIEGHASTQPLGNPNATKKESFKYNQKLSEARTQELYKALIKKGMSENTVYISSYGQNKLVDKDQKLSAHEKNRRVEVKVSVKSSFSQPCSRLAQIAKSANFKKVGGKRKYLSSYGFVSAKEFQTISKQDGYVPESYDDVLVLDEITKATKSLSPAELKKLDSIKNRLKNNTYIQSSCFNGNNVVLYSKERYAPMPDEMHDIINQLSRNQRKIRNINIRGHSTNRPDDDERFTIERSIKKNKALAQERLQEIKETLTFRGFENYMVSIKNLGNSQPISDIENESAYKKNRRIEVKPNCIK